MWNSRKNKMEACVSVSFSPSPARSKRSLTNFSFCLLAVILCRLPGALSAQLSVEKSLVFGPGVHPERAGFPVNYFYIQAVDTKGKNFSDVDDTTFEVNIESDSSRVRRRTESTHLGRGLVLYQYRPFDDYESVTVSVRYEGHHVGKSPYVVPNVFHENCACPLIGVEEWLERHQCGEVDKQIAEDLAPFRENGVNITDLYERSGKAYERNSFVHYSIVDGKLYAHTFGSIVGFKYLSDMILLSIVNKVQMPDLEMIVNLGDWPLNKNRPNHPLLPVFSWCGSPDTRDIIWPTWDMMKATIMALDRVSLSILSVQKTRNIPWDEREPRVFFRGRDSNKNRLELVKQNRRNTELFDVGITNWFFFPYDEEVYGPKMKSVSFHDFFKYKYQLNIDGTVAAYRFPYLLAGGSLVLKQDSDYYEHFYHQLEPWVHYVPVKKDISDLMERLEWARENDDKAREMADNAAQFVQDHLLPEQLYCYVFQLLKEYASLQVGSRPQVHEGMEPAIAEVPHDCTNTCNKIRAKSEKKKKTKEEL